MKSKTIRFVRERFYIHGTFPADAVAKLPADVADRFVKEGDAAHVADDAAQLPAEQADDIVQLVEVAADPDAAPDEQR